MEPQKISLQAISFDDLPLWEALQCDPVMMAELGGPQPKEKMPKILQNSLEYVRSGRGWAYKIVLEDSQTAIGSVSIWEGDWDGMPIDEMGWMVLPAYQGQGLGKQACRTLLDKARTDGRWNVIHAFPGVNNLPSNGICRALGFTLLDACDIDYADRILRCNHWRIDLSSINFP